MTTNFTKGPTFSGDMKEVIEVVRTGNFVALNTDGQTFKVGTYTMVAADDTAGLTDIVTGLSSVSAFIVQILTAAGVVTAADVVLTVTDGTIRVADGSSYALTAGHFAKWIAIGVV